MIGEGGCSLTLQSCLWGWMGAGWGWWVAGVSSQQELWSFSRPLFGFSTAAVCWWVQEGKDRIHMRRMSIVTAAGSIMLPPSSPIRSSLPPPFSGSPFASAALPLARRSARKNRGGKCNFANSWICQSVSLWGGALIAG